MAILAGLLSSAGAVSALAQVTAPPPGDFTLDCGTSTSDDVDGETIRNNDTSRLNVKWVPGTVVEIQIQNQCNPNANCQAQVTTINPQSGTWSYNAPVNQPIRVFPNQAFNWRATNTNTGGSGTNAWLLERITAQAVTWSARCRSPERRDLTVEKTSTDKYFTKSGDVLDYKILVTNTGNVQLSDVVVQDPKIGTLNCTGTGTLQPGQSKTCTGTYTVSPADVTNKKVDNTATASAAGVSPKTDELSIPLAAIELSKTANPVQYDEAGDKIGYTITATNSGSYTLTDVAITDPGIGTLPPSCSAASLAAGKTLVCKAAYTIKQADVDNGSFLNTAAVNTDQTEKVTAEATITSNAVPQVSLKKTASPATFGIAGATIKYTIRATNSGPVTLTGVVIADPWLNKTCEVTSLAPGESADCDATYVTTEEDLDKKSLVNTATVNTEQTKEVTAQATITSVAVATVSLEKIAEPETYDAAGEVIDYTLTATNSGPVTLNNVAITDPQLGKTCEVIKTLAPGASASCTASYTTTQEDVDKGSYVNTAFVDTDETEKVSADATITARQDQAITLTKVASPDTFDSAGDEISYTMTATNTGNTTLTSVVITDTKLEKTCTVEALDPGKSATCEADYTTTQADVDAGRVVNTAMVDTAETEDVTAEATITATQSAALSIDKSSSDTTYKAVGDVLDYTILVANTGNVTLTNLSVTDPLIPGLDCGRSLPTTLAPGEELNCTGSYAATQGDLDAGRVVNTATATANFGETPLSESDSVTIVDAPSREVEKPIQSTTYNFMAKRLDLLSMHGPRLSWLVNRAEDGFGQGSNGFNVVGENGNVTGDFAFNSGMFNRDRGRQVMVPAADAPPVRSDGVNVWIEGQFALYQDERDDEDANGDFFVGYAGADIEVMDRVILGVMAELDWMSEDTDDANVDGTGWMIGPYLSAEIADGIFLDLRGMGGGSSNSVDQDIEGVNYNGDFDTARWLAEGTLSGNFDLESVKVTPDVRFLYIWEGQDDFDVNGDGEKVGISGNDMNLTQLSTGLRLSHLSQHDGFDMRSYLAGRLFWNIDDPGELTYEGEFVSDDEFSASVTLGMDIRSDDMQFGIEGTYDGLFAEDSAIGGRLSFGYQF